MKYLKYLNLFALVLPFAIAIISIFHPPLLIYAIMSTAVTGGLQVIVALALWCINPENFQLYIYFAITALFFSFVWFEIINWYVYSIPVGLAVYLTYILYIESNKRKK